MRFAFLVFAAIAITACSHSDDEARAAQEGHGAGGPITVATVPASSLRSREYLEFTGVLFPAQDVTVMASVPGDVAEIRAEEGDFVKRGEPLAILDQTEFRIAVSQAEHGLEAARLALKQLELDYARNESLHKSGSITDSQLEQIKLKLDLAKNQVKQAEDGLRMARKKLNDTVIRAPFDCYVTNRLVSVGSHITAMPPTVLFRVIDISNLDFKMNIPDTYLRHIKVGDRVLIRFDTLDNEVEARVTRVVTSIDPRSMTFTVVASIDNKGLGHALKPGVMGRAKVFVEGLGETFVVDKSAFKQVDLDKGHGVLFVVEGEKARAREVSFEAIDDLRVRVKKGLKDSDRLITSGVSALEDGMPVTIVR